MFNRIYWKENMGFTNENPNFYSCPKCFKGFLQLSSIEKKITDAGRRNQDQGYPYGIDHLFTAILICSNSDCLEMVTTSGTCQIDCEVPIHDEDGNTYEKYVNFYSPKNFFPNLKLFPLDKAIPSIIKEQINLAFHHFFFDFSSCANKIRTAIELILDEIKAPNYSIISQRSNCPIRSTSCSRNQVAGRKIRKNFSNLHQRIENYSKKRNSKIGNLLLANKIIGNEGSHKGEIDLEDILDAFEILEAILNRLFVKPDARIDDLANEITQKRRPRSKR